MLLAQYRLAFLLGKTIGELVMSWDEFVHWLAYLEIEPPEAGAQQRTAALLAQVTNMSGKSVKRPVKPSDFIGERKPARQSMQDQIAFLKSIGK